MPVEPPRQSCVGQCRTAVCWLWEMIKLLKKMSIIRSGSRNQLSPLRSAHLNTDKSSLLQRANLKTQFLVFFFFSECK